MLKTSTLNVVVPIWSPTPTVTVPAHPPLLVLLAICAHTAVDVRGVGAVLQVVITRRPQMAHNNGTDAIRLCSASASMRTCCQRPGAC
jgi:hypothetical protein